MRKWVQNIRRLAFNLIIQGFGNRVEGVLRNVWRALMTGATSMEQLGENINAFNKAGAVA